jgi:uncharacterized protein
MSEVLNDLTVFVRKKLENSPSCHDWEHTKRVLKNALIISETLINDKIKVDMKVVKAGALLHDIARPEELTSDSKVCHAQLGAELVPGILKHLQISDISHTAVAQCVRAHRFRNRGQKPKTIEEKIIFDADKLDSLGAIGVARAIHFSGRIGSVLHNKLEVAVNSEPYSREDSAYREFLIKLRYIPDKMLTSPGRTIAAERYLFMEIFFKKMNEEFYGISALV